VSDTPPAAPNQPESRPGPHRLPPHKKILVRIAALIVRIWTRTLRLHFSPEFEALVEDTSKPTIYCFWHNQLLIAPRIRTDLLAHRRVAGLISGSKDGAWLAELFGSFRIDAVRGSSSRFGVEALRDLVIALRSGSDAAITPDGPRGPAYHFEAGTLVAARRAGARVVLSAAIMRRAWRLDTWDGFLLPVPFSRVDIHGLAISEEVLAEGRGSASAVGKNLLALSAENDRLHPMPPRMRKKLASAAGT
jgi:lysophospholipid acyltransferase (LPLAT)-like uncharacterized protein